MSNNVAAILVAAGAGQRFTGAGEALPKQFMDFRGQPLFMWPLEILAGHPRIENIVVVTVADKVLVVEKIIAEAQLSKKIRVIGGGATRQESVWCGLRSLAREIAEDSLVIVHDAARPFLTTEIIDATISGAEETGACTTGIPVSDTIKSVRAGLIESTLDRTHLISVQTPQAGRLDWMLDAHEKARKKGLATTDDAALLEAAGHKVKVVPGSSCNLKVTNNDDLVLAEALAQILF